MGESAGGDPISTRVQPIPKSKGQSLYGGGRSVAIVERKPQFAIRGLFLFGFRAILATKGRYPPPLEVPLKRVP